MPHESITFEKSEPDSERRHPNDNIPLVWAQSLYILGRLMRNGYLQPGDIDPLGRHRRKSHRDPVVQILLLSEDVALADELAAHQQYLNKLEKETGYCVWRGHE